MKCIRTGTLALAIIFTGLTGCGGGNPGGENVVDPPKSMLDKTESDPMEDKGIGPVTELILPDEINQEMATRGKEIYDLKCTACHKPEAKFIGPAPKGIFERRNPVWIMNMILNPDVMVRENPIAKKLLIEFNGSPMANQNLTQEEARAVLEYFRTL